SRSRLSCPWRSPDLAFLCNAWNVARGLYFSRGTSPGARTTRASPRERDLGAPSARSLEFEEGGEIELAPGDWVDIPAHVRHRVTWTAPDLDMIWLAIFYS